MGQINTGRVLLAGLAAGVVIDIGEGLAHGVIFASQMASMMEQMGVEIGGSQLVMYNVLGLAIGITVAWIYAAIRPRLEPGPMTGVCAGLVAWALWSLFHVVDMWIAGMLPVHLALSFTVYQAVEMSIAGLVAGMLYKE
jgi:hypothetical protein